MSLFLLSWLNILSSNWSAVLCRQVEGNSATFWLSLVYIQISVSGRLHCSSVHWMKMELYWALSKPAPPGQVSVWLTDRLLTNCLCVSMGNGAASRQRGPAGYPSVSRGGFCGGVWYVSPPRLMDRKYSQRNNICRIYIQKNISALLHV